ncbi:MULTISPECIES: sulfite exporter TauE/SafE family protein [unclassified Luteococcus]|uniref:sulfite exporter TauE/SafE family protein n=1 Tax=unclassified Luteococcus TaxID=2639923 RepID=UPI00313EAFC8
MNFLADLQWLVAIIGGFLAGGINVMVGAGTLISFPLLVLSGVPPLTATIANTMGLVPASATGVVAYRDELRRLRGVIRTLLPASILGGATGALLLLGFPAGVFVKVVPWLVAVGTALVLAGPSIRGWVASRRDAEADEPSSHGVFTSRRAMVGGVIGCYLVGSYGGYFSAAQGILLVGLLGIVTHLGMQDLNAIKNFNVLFVNAMSAGMVLLVSPELINWKLAGLVAVGAALGGLTGGRFAKRLSPRALRIFVVTVGVTTTLAMLLR